MYFLSIPRPCFYSPELSANEDDKRAEKNPASSSQPTSTQPAASIQPYTLAQWPDPTGIFADTRDIDKYILNEKELPVALDHKGAVVHPSRYSAVFTDGVWAVADVFMHLSVCFTFVDTRHTDLLSRWDMSRSKRVVEKTKTYQLRLAQIRALNPPRIAAEDVDPKTAVVGTSETTIGTRQDTVRTLKRPAPRPLPGFGDVDPITNVNAPASSDNYAPASAVPPKKKQRTSRLSAKDKGKGRAEEDMMEMEKGNGHAEEDTMEMDTNDASLSQMD